MYAPTQRQAFVSFCHVETMLSVLMDTGLSSSAIACNAWTSDGGNDTLVAVGFHTPAIVYSSPHTLAVLHKSTSTTRQEVVALGHLPIIRDCLLLAA